MADYYYSSPSDFVASFDRRLKQRRLGGATYDPRLTTDVARGAYSAAVSKMLDRKKAADAKEASDKALDLQEQSIANTKEYQTGSLAATAEANKIKAREAENANTYRMGALDTADAARKDASDAALYNAALNLGGKLFNGLFQTETKDPKTGQITRRNAAYDWFRDTVMGGEEAGSGAGYAIGDYGDVTPEQNAMYEAEATVPVTASPSIGTNVSQGTPTNDIMTQAYDDSMTSEKPKGSGYNLASADTGTMNDAGGSLPAIGEQVSDRSIPGSIAKYEDIDIGTQMAEDTGISTGSGSDAANYQAPEWNGRPPDAWQDPDPFQAEEYVAPELEGYTAPTLDPWNYTKKPSDWTEAMWRAQGGEYGPDWRSDFESWQGNEYRKDALGSQAKHKTWAAEQLAASRNAYDTWATEQNALSKADYDQRIADAEAEYNDYWGGEKAKYDDAVNKYNDAVKNYEAGVNGVGAEEPPWDYNRGGIGGAPADDYYGDAFIRGTGSVAPEAFDPSGFAGDASTRRVAKNYMPANPSYTPKAFDAGNPTAYALGGREYNYEPAGAVAYNPTSYNAAFNYEPPNYESPYRYSSYYDPNRFDTTPNYEPAPSYDYDYDPTPNYEPGYGDEAPNYEPGVYEPFKPEAPPASATTLGTPSVSVDTRSGTPMVKLSFGKIVCTELNRQGYLPAEVLAKDSECRVRFIPENVYAGYLTLFGPVVALMRRSKAFTNIVRPFGVATATEMASRVDPRIKGSLLGKLILKVGIPLCGLVGRMEGVKNVVNNTEVA